MNLKTSCLVLILRQNAQWKCELTEHGQESTASGKPFEVKFYHYLTFDEDGMLINGGDYGDATGVVMAVAPDPES